MEADEGCLVECQTEAEQVGDTQMVALFKLEVVSLALQLLGTLRRSNPSLSHNLLIVAWIWLTQGE